MSIQNFFGEKQFSTMIALFFSDIIMIAFDMTAEAFLISIFFSTVYTFVISFAFMNIPKMFLQVFLDNYSFAMRTLGFMGIYFSA